MCNGLLLKTSRHFEHKAFRSGMLKLFIDFQGVMGNWTMDPSLKEPSKCTQPQWVFKSLTALPSQDIAQIPKQVQILIMLTLFV